MPSDLRRSSIWVTPVTPVTQFRAFPLPLYYSLPSFPQRNRHQGRHRCHHRPWSAQKEQFTTSFTGVTPSPLLGVTRGPSGVTGVTLVSPAPGVGIDRPQASPGGGEPQSSHPPPALGSRCSRCSGGCRSRVVRRSRSPLLFVLSRRREPGVSSVLWVPTFAGLPGLWGRLTRRVLWRGRFVRRLAVGPLVGSCSRAREMEGPVPRSRTTWGAGAAPHLVQQGGEADPAGPYTRGAGCNRIRARVGRSHGFHRCTCAQVTALGGESHGGTARAARARALGGPESPDTRPMRGPS